MLNRLFAAVSALAVLFWVSASADEPVFINEFMANNATALADENSDYSDWIELRNTSATAVNLNGYYLTDNASNLKKWKLPSTNIVSNGYLIIFASGKDRSAPRLHANFSLDADGEYLALVKPDGVTKISEFIKFPQQYKDYSYGLDSTGTNWVYFSRGTPNAVNSGGVIAFVKDTKFSQNRGYYTTPFDVAITSETAGATIRYTTNGTVPTLANGFTYAAPLRINGTTTLRAAAFKTGFQPSNVDTHTYLFVTDVVNQAANGQAPAGWPASWGGNVVDYGMDPNVVNDPLYRGTITNDLKTLPVFSITMNVFDLFDPATGIYANPGNDGAAWERPCSVEYIRPDGAEGFQVNAGIRVRGGFSRSTGNPKHAFRFFFREEYGNSKLKYPLFGDNGADEFNKIDLRTFQNYSWSFQGDARGVFIRDVFSRDTQLAMGQQGERGDYCHLYINGMYWGIYNTDERAEANYGETYFGGNADNYDTIKVEAGSYTIEATDGNLVAWTALFNQASAGLASNTAYFKIQGRNPDGTRNLAYSNYVDVANLIDYMLVIVYGGNLDAPISNFLGNTSPNNWYGLRDRTGTNGFRFISHDAEHTLLDVGANRMGPFTAGQGDLSKSNPQFLWQQMWNNPEFQMLAADRIHKHFFNDGALTPASAIARFRNRMAQLDRAVVAESARWGDAKREPAYTRATWVAACNTILTSFFPNRTTTVLTQLRGKNLYPATVAPTFSQHGGNVPKGYSLGITAPTSTIYYTLNGSDPRLIGGAVSPAAIQHAAPLILNQSTLVRSRVLNGTNWSAMNEALFNVIQTNRDLAITEIMYHPLTPDGIDASDLEFIELKNISATELDLSGMRFTNGIAFTFPLGQKLSPGRFAVLVKNAEAFAIRYPTVPIAGVYTNRLDNGGETLALIHAAGAPIASVTFSDLAPWPVGPDGAGFSLVPRHPNANPDANNPANWRASARVGGSPGADDPAIDVPIVVVNEVLTHTDLPAVDKIELHNPNTTEVDIGGWFLTDDRLTPKKFLIPAGTRIPAGEYVVFSENDFNATPGVGNSFSLSSHGDEVFLYSADSLGNLTGFSDGFSFGGAENSVTFGRYTNSVGEVLFPAQLTSTLGAANSGPRVGPVVINEIRYAPKPGDEEFVELRNLTASAIKLYDVDRPTNRWKITGLDYTFPANAEIPAHGYLVIASVDPSLFRAHNSIPVGVPVFGPFTGVLQDNGEDLELKRPDAPDENPDGSFSVPYITVDQVRYNNNAPWPTAAAGTGPSLERIVSSAFGNDPANWRASLGAASPGLNNNGNRPPVVDAGPDGASTSASFPVDVTLAPTVTDDGQPAPALLQFNWTQVSGPGVVIFGNPNTRATTAALPGVGHYTLRLTVSDGEYSTNDDVEFQMDRPLSAQTFVTAGSTWKFLDDNSNQGTAWIATDFNDTAWQQGPARLGYGGDGEVTVVNGGPTSARYVTTYFRRTFNVPSVAGLRDLTVRIIRDDGAIVYLNGTEIFRSNMPEGPINYQTPASGTVGGADELAWFEKAVSPSLLNAGANVLAIEVHQINGTSSDLGIDLELVGQISGDNAPPIANAGGDLIVTLPADATLDGTVRDDGLPLSPGAPANTWSKISGPGTVTFANAAAAKTTARFSAPGIYVLRLFTTDGQFTAQSDITVDVRGNDAYGTWKSAHFSSAELANPALSGDDADPDGDNFRNVAEFLAGTDPRNGASYLGLGSILTDTGIELRFEGMPGRIYEIWTRGNIDSGIWDQLQSVDTGASQRIIQVELHNDLEPHRYYRVGLQP